MKQTQNNKLTERTEGSKSQSTDKKNLFLGGVIVLIIACTPLLFYSYKSFSGSTTIWETFLFTIDTKYSSIMHYAWYFVGKFVPLLLLFIWFFTCKHWWHWIILIPIAMYSFQLFSIIRQSGGIDETEIFYIFPIMMILVPFVYLIRAKIFDKVRGDDLKNFEEELAKPMTIWDQLRDLFK